MAHYKAQYPQESSTMATLSERLRAEGMQKGMQQGMQQGVEQGMRQGMQQGVEQGIQQGMQQGMQQGEAAALKKLISLKFGELPGWAEEQIQSAALPELEMWLEAILTADTWETLLNRH